MNPISYEIMCLTGENAFDQLVTVVIHNITEANSLSISEELVGCQSQRVLLSDLATVAMTNPNAEIIISRKRL